MKEYLERPEDKDVEFDEKDIPIKSYSRRDDMIDNIAKVHLKDMFVEH